MGAKNDGGGSDNWSCKTCKAPFKSPPPPNQHVTLYRPNALLVDRPTNSEKALNWTTGSIITSGSRGSAANWTTGTL